MAITFLTKDTRPIADGRGTEFRSGVMGNKWFKEFEFNIANSTPAYATAAGGLVLSADGNGGNSKFGMASVESVNIESTGGYVFQYERTTDSITMRQGNAGSSASVLPEVGDANPPAVTNVKGIVWGTL